VTALLRLYPRDWRERYGDEFLALLESKPPDLLDRVDIVRGAVDARLHPQERPAGEPEPPPPADGRVSDRGLGLAIAFGAALVVVAMVVAINGPMVVGEGGSYRDGGAAIPFLLGAALLLAVGLVRTATQLPSAAEGGRAAAVLAAVFAVWWSAMIWIFLLWIVASFGILALGVSAYRTGTWGRADATLVLGALGASWLIGAGALLGAFGASPDAYVVFFLLLTPMWLGLGHAVAKARSRTMRRQAVPVESGPR